MLIGYARVSTMDQTLQLQLDAFNKAGVERVYSEKISGKSKDRPQLTEMFKILRAGDKIVVYKLDRLGRSLKDLISIIEELNTLNVDLQILEGLPIDTSNASGKLMFQIIAAFAEYEKDLISERTKAGLASARARGKIGGRRPINKDHIDFAISLHRDREKNYSISEIIQKSGISRTTFYRYLKIRENI